MKKELYKTIEIPEGVNVEITQDEIKATGPKGESRREIRLPALIHIKKEGSNVQIGGPKISKKEKKIMNTLAAHIKNLIQGVTETFEYQLKVCSSHFPMTVTVSGDKAEVKNFLGEKIPRKVSLPKGVNVEVKKDLITITSTDKELAGQAAANLERSTKVGKRDRRVFQDGIFIIQKAGRDI